MIHMLTCAYKRLELLKIFLDNYLRLAQDNEIACTVVCSGKPAMTLCQKYPVNIILHPNNPLSDKWNVGLKSIKYHKWDSLLIMGSDDLIYDLSVYDDSPYQAYKDMYFYDKETHDTWYWKGYIKEQRPIGAGRLISRQLIEERNYQLWKPGLNKNLDASMDLPEPKLLSCKDDFNLMSIKTSRFITPLNTYKRNAIQTEDIRRTQQWEQLFD